MLRTTKLHSLHIIPTTIQQMLPMLNAHMFHGLMSKLVNIAPTIRHAVATHFNHLSMNSPSLLNYTAYGDTCLVTILFVAMQTFLV